MGANIYDKYFKITCWGRIFKIIRGCVDFQVSNLHQTLPQWYNNNDKRIRIAHCMSFNFFHEHGERNCHPVANQYFLHIWMAASIIKMTIISEYPPTMGDHYFRIPQDASPDWHRPARRMRFIRSKTNIIITICKHCNHNLGIGSAYLSLIRIWICAIFGSGFPRLLAAGPRLSSEEGSECVNTGAPLVAIIILMTMVMVMMTMWWWWQSWWRWWWYIWWGSLFCSFYSSKKLFDNQKKISGSNDWHHENYHIFMNEK